MTAPSERPIRFERIRHTLYTLIFGTSVCTAMLLVRFIYVWDLRFRFSGLLGNILLAWIPLVLALFIRYKADNQKRLWFWSALVAWFLFFPNAFYITTDLIHTKKFGTDGIYFWYDMLMTASFACAGAFLGSLSLYLMQLFIRQRFGWRAGWAFSTLMLALGSFGIYLGRFLKLNSWDALIRPFKLAGDISALVNVKTLQEVAAFSVTFFFFSLVVYVFVVSMARLHEESREQDGQPASDDES